MLQASSEPEPLAVGRASQQTPSQPEPRQRTEEEEKEEGTVRSVFLKLLDAINGVCLKEPGKVCSRKVKV